MAICGNCGAESARIRSRWDDKGRPLSDQCHACAPETFDKFTAPSDKKIWMGYEAHPNEYVQAADGGYDRKPEYRAEQEAKLVQGANDDAEAQRIAEERKRAERRTEPMTPTELRYALEKARRIAESMEQSTKYDA